MKKRAKNSLDAPSTKRDVEDMGAHIVSAIAKTLEDYATKEDLKNLVTKDDLKSVEKKLGDKIDNLGGDVSDLRRRVSDLEADTVTRREFNDFKTKVLPQ